MKFDKKQHDKKQEYINRVKKNGDLVYELASDFHLMTEEYLAYTSEIDSKKNHHELNNDERECYLFATSHLRSLVITILPLYLSLKSCYEQVCLISDIDHTFDNEAAHKKLYATESYIYRLISVADITSPIPFPDKFRGVWFYEPLHDKL